MHDLRVAEPPEPEAEVERRARHDHEIGLLQRDRPSARERELVVGGQRAASHAVHERRARAPLPTKSRSACSASSQYTSPPATSTGRAAAPTSSATAVDVVGVGRGAAIDDRIDRRRRCGPGPNASSGDVDERRPAVRRARDEARRVDLVDDRSAAFVAVTARFTTGSTIGTWFVACLQELKATS